MQRGGEERVTDMEGVDAENGSAIARPEADAAAATKEAAAVLVRTAVLMLARSRYSLHSPVRTPPRAYTHSDSCVSLLTLDEILLRSALDRTGLSAMCQPNSGPRLTGLANVRPKRESKSLSGHHRDPSPLALWPLRKLATMVTVVCGLCVSPQGEA